MTLPGLLHMAGVRVRAALSCGPDRSTLAEQGDTVKQNQLVVLRTVIAACAAVVFGSLITVSVLADSAPISERLATLEAQVRVDDQYRSNQMLLNAAAITALQSDVTNLKTSISMFNGMYAALGGIVSLLTIVSIIITLKSPSKYKS